MCDRDRLLHFIGMLEYWIYWLVCVLVCVIHVCVYVQWTGDTILVFCYTYMYVYVTCMYVCTCVNLSLAYVSNEA